MSEPFSNNSWVADSCPFIAASINGEIPSFDPVLKEFSEIDSCDRIRRK
jgi:hypothetical protein